MTMTDLVYHCAAGESFDSIALRLYGHEKYAEDLMQANPGYCGLAVFDGGETLARSGPWRTPLRRGNYNGLRPAIESPQAGLSIEYINFL